MKNSCILQIFAQITACLGCGGPTKQLGSFPHKLCHKSGKKRSNLFRPFASSHATQRVHSKGSGGTKWGLGHTPPAPDVRSHASYSTSLLTSRGIITIIILNIILNVSPSQQGHAQAARARGRGCSATTRGNVPPLKSTPVPAPISSTRMSTSTTTADFDSPIVISF